MENKTIILIVVGVVTLLGVIIALAKTFKRSTGRSLLRLIFIAASAIIAYIVSAGVLTKYASNLIDVASNTGLSSSITSALSSYLSTEGTVGIELTNLTLKIFAPILYFLVFFVVNFVLWILYLIFAAIFTKKLTPETKASRPAGDKIVALVINLAIQLIICTSLFFPVNGYIAMTDSVLQDETTISELVNSEDDVDTFMEIYGNIKDNKINDVCYYKLTKLVTDKMTTLTIKDDKGDKIETTVDKCLSTIIKAVPMAKQITEVDDTKNSSIPLNSQALLDMAKVLEDNKYLDRLFGVAFQELADNGELNKLIGAIMTENNKDNPDATEWNYDLPVIDNLLAGNEMNEGLITSIRNALKSTKYASTALTAVANITNLANAISTTEENVSSSFVELVAQNLNPDNAEFIKSALSTDVVTTIVGEENREMAEVVTSAITCVVDGLLELDEEEYQAEAQAIGEIFTIYSDSSTKTEALKDDEVAERVITAIQDSTVVESLVETLTEHGTKQPIDLGLNDDAIDTLVEKLGTSSIEEGSDFYNSILAFFGRPVTIPQE